MAFAADTLARAPTLKNQWKLLPRPMTSFVKGTDYEELLASRKDNGAEAEVFTLTCESVAENGDTARRINKVHQ